MIKFLGRKNILDANIFYEKLISKKLKDNDLCLTFDDGIKSQIDVALPVLEDLKIKSFFFVYSSMFEGKPDHLEIFRYFRNSYFSNINAFYKSFYKILDKDLNKFFIKNQKLIKTIKKRSPFYSLEDIKFRLIRDIYLSKSRYKKIMQDMMKDKKFVSENYYEKLFFKKKDLKDLSSLGHIIGLHSHSHPTLIEKLSYEDQKKEYKKCLSTISQITNQQETDIKCMSHPCGSYNENTLKVLDDLGIKLGFKQFMSIEKNKGMTKLNNSNLEIARKDHSEVLKSMI